MHMREFWLQTVHVRKQILKRITFSDGGETTESVALSILVTFVFQTMNMRKFLA